MAKVSRATAISEVMMRRIAVFEARSEASEAMGVSNAQERSVLVGPSRTRAEASSRSTMTVDCDAQNSQVIRDHEMLDGEIAEWEIIDREEAIQHSDLPSLSRLQTELIGIGLNMHSTLLRHVRR